MQHRDHEPVRQKLERRHREPVMAGVNLSSPADETTDAFTRRIRKLRDLCDDGGRLLRVVGSSMEDQCSYDPLAELVSDSNIRLGPLPPLLLGKHGGDLGARR